MRLTRRQSIGASVAILVLFFLGVAFLRPGSHEDAQVTSTDESASQDMPAEGPDFVLDNFQRQEIKGNRKVWEIKAQKGRYNPASGKAALEHAMLWLYKKDGGLVTLQSDKAILKLVGTEGLETADFTGNVVIVQDNEITINTDQATYDKAKDLVVAPNLVKITGDKLNLEGMGMEVTVSTKDMRLLKSTKTLLEPKESKAPQAKVSEEDKKKLTPAGKSK